MLRGVFPAAITDQGGTFTRGSTGTYIDLDGYVRTAQEDELRVGRDGVVFEGVGTGQAPSSHSNRISRSQEFDNATWTKSGITVTANSVAAPDLTTTADTLTASGAGSTITQTYNSGVSGYPNVLSVFLKAGTASLVRLGETTSGVYLDIDLAAGTSTLSTGAAVTPPIELADGWWRVQMPYQATGSAGAFRLTFGPGTIYAWGAQFEPTNNGIARSYIPTTSATATRATDTFSGSGLLYSSVASDEFVDEDGSVTAVSAWSNVSSYAIGALVSRQDGDVLRIFRSLLGETRTVTFEAATPGNVRWSDGAKNPQILAKGTQVTFTTTGTLPAPPAVSTNYYVIDANDRAFTISDALNGTPLAITGAGTGTHTVVLSSNVGNDPLTSPLFWEELPAPSRMAPFDGEVNTQSIGSDQMVVAFAPGQISTITLMNLYAEFATVSVLSRSGINISLVYTETFRLLPPNLQAWEEPVARRTTVPIVEIPGWESITDPIVVIALRGDGPVKAGMIHVGQIYDLGDLQYGAGFDLSSFTQWNFDAFGRVKSNKKPFYKTLEGELMMKKDSVDFNEVCRVRQLLIDVPTVYYSLNSEAALLEYEDGAVIYAIFEQFRLIAAGPNHNTASVRFRGMV